MSNRSTSGHYFHDDYSRQPRLYSMEFNKYYTEENIIFQRLYEHFTNHGIIFKSDEMKKALEDSMSIFVEGKIFDIDFYIREVGFNNVHDVLSARHGSGRYGRLYLIKKVYNLNNNTLKDDCTEMYDKLDLVKLIMIIKERKINIEKL